MNAVHPPETFYSLIGKERERTDRTGRAFSLVMFEPADASDFSRFSGALSNILSKRLRAYDYVSRVNHTRIGAILPETTEQNARQVAEEITHTLRDVGIDASHTVLTYPHSWLAGQDDRGAEKDPLSNLCSDITHWAEANQKLLTTLGPEMQPCLPFWKRIMDIFGSLCGLVLLAPVLCLIALYIKIVSPGPVLFRQERIGYLGQSFSCWKFRTMHINAEAATHTQHFSALMQSDAPMCKLDNTDPRIIPYGTFLRKTGLDELPQLFNVLLGEMSLIGPRPCIPYEAQGYKVWQRKRFDTVPGITGLWQVSGKNKTTFSQMMRYDIIYTKKKSLALDTSILFKTIPAIMKQVSDKL
jgi:lipopolysaccharide/colanic/teichoic acid biosynthesis glycosyltransferase